MKIIYIDSNFKCHADNATGRTAIETDAFDDMCNGEIECYIYKPLDGGRCFIQCFASTKADSIRRQHESDEQAHLEEMAALIEEIYNEDLEVIGE